MSQPKPIRIGVIGASPKRWASIAHLTALRGMPQYRVVAVSTTRIESARETANHHGIPYAFSDSLQLARHPEVDVVSICVKVPEHRTLVAAAAAAGKHIYCEWPLALNSAEAAELVAIAEEARVTHMVGLQARGSSTVNYARDLLAGKCIGEVLSCTMITSTWGWGGGGLPAASAYVADPVNGATALSVTGGHSLDALCFLLGEFQSISGLVINRRKTAVLENTGKTIATTSPDQVALVGVLEGGVVATIHIKGSSHSWAGFWLEINGIDGDLILSSRGPVGLQLSELTLRLAKAGDTEPVVLEIPDEYREVPAAIPNGPAFNVAQLYAKFAKAIRGQGADIPDFRLALRRHRLLDQVALASAEGARQVVPRLGGDVPSCRNSKALAPK